MARVAVTGAGFYSPIGNEWDDVAANLENGANGVRYFADWTRYDGLNALLGADVKHFDPPPSFTRKRTRTMGRVSLLATAASERPGTTPARPHSFRRGQPPRGRRYRRG